jgi:hypothetical protein
LLLMGTFAQRDTELGYQLTSFSSRFSDWWLVATEGMMLSPLHLRGRTWQVFVNTYLHLHELLSYQRVCSPLSAVPLTYWCVGLYRTNHTLAICFDP